MNVRAEAKALVVFMDSLPDKIDSGELPRVALPELLRYLQGRITLLERHAATEEFAEFQRIVEASGYETPTRPPEPLRDPF